MAKKKSAKKAKKPVKVASAPDPAKYNHIINRPFRAAVTKAGGIAKLALALGVSRQAIHKWEAIPDRFAVRVEELYKIPRAEVAPHLYK
jgi:hypothetical protein